jgi:hypothetical protein
MNRLIVNRFNVGLEELVSTGRTTLVRVPTGADSSLFTGWGTRV